MDQSFRPYSSSLRDKVNQIKIENWQGETFIPYFGLIAILDDTSVRNVIRECGVQIYRVEETVEAILKGGHRLFGILNAMGKESLLLDFTRADSFLNKPLDSALPYEEQSLESILEKDYRDFYDRQWDFTSPIFKKHLHERRLPKRTILPFTAVQKVENQGSFANASFVKIPSSHQDIFKTSSPEVSEETALNQPPYPTRFSRLNSSARI